jgi:hypothetical protein
MTRTRWDNPGRKQNGPRAKELPVEYRDIRYTVRARILRDEWTVSIHPADIESPRRVVTGREKAELLAQSMIDRWHETRGAERSESEPAQRTYVSKHGTVATMNIAALNKHKRDSDLPSVSLPPPERRSDAEVVSLSERFEANRDQFEDMLRQIERLIGSFPPTAAMRAINLAEDDALAQRLSSTGRELIKQGEFIMLKWKLKSGPLSG